MKSTAPAAHLRPNVFLQELGLLFYLASFLGWVFEVAVFWGANGFSASLWTLLASYRGVLHGTWAPIYGVGCVLLVLLRRLLPGSRVRFAAACMAACAVVEYGTAWALETLFQAKWWDYTGLFLNLHGRICFLSVVGFGTAGALIALYGFPLYERLVQSLPARVRLAGLALLSGLFLWDVCTALVFSPNMGLGVTGIG